VDILVEGHIGRRYYDLGDRVLHDPSPGELTELLTELCTPYEDSRWWTHAILGHVDAKDAVQIVVAPQSGYIALSWTGTAERSLNPHPFVDAPLLPDSGDDEPLIYWPRSSFIPAVEARKALAEHIATGVQPTCVQWQPWGWEVRERPIWLEPDMPEYGAFHLIDD
jgi:hypothetical protein